MANKNIDSELQFVSNLCLSKALSHNYIKNWCENKNTPMEVIPKKKPNALHLPWVRCLSVHV